MPNINQKQLKPPVSKNTWMTSDRWKSASTTNKLRPPSSQSKVGGSSTYDTSSYHNTTTQPDENSNHIMNNYQSMSQGSRAIIEQKQREEQNLNEKMKNELFSKYGGSKSDVSIVDFYIQSQNKSKYVTEGIQKFENSVILSLQKI